jgi:hypothetical protein
VGGFGARAARFCRPSGGFGVWTGGLDEILAQVVFFGGWSCFRVVFLVLFFCSV